MKTKRSRVVALLLVAIMVFSLVSSALPAMAATGEEPDVYQTYTGWRGFLVDGGGKIPRYGTSRAYVMYGEAAYCLDPNLPNGPVVPSDNLDSEIEEALKAAISFGYSFKNHMFLGEPVDDTTSDSLQCYFMATQVLVWEIAQHHRTPGDWSNQWVTVSSLNELGKPGVAERYTELLSTLQKYEAAGRDPAAPFMPEGFYSTIELALKNRTEIDSKAAIAEGKDRITISYPVGAENIKRFEGMRLYKGTKEDMAGFNEAWDNQISGSGSDPQGKLTTTKLGISYGDNKLFPIIDGSYPECGFYGVTANDGYLFLGFSLNTFTQDDEIIVKIYRPGKNTPRTDGTLSFYDAEVSGKYQRRVQYNPTTPKNAVVYAAFTMKKQPDIISKIWDDNGNVDGERPVSVDIDVYDGNVLKATLKLGFEADKKTPLGKTAGKYSDNEWRYPIENEPWYVPGTNYSIKEKPVEGYVPSINGLAVTNRNGAPTLRKVWADNHNKAGTRPASVTMAVFDNTEGKKVATVHLGFQADKKTPLEGTTGKFEDNEWKYDLTKAGWFVEGHSYTLIEDPVSGYQSSSSGLTVTNKKAIEDKPPEFDFPSFDVRADKNDTKGGFDDNIHTPRGNGSLAATFDFTVESGNGSTLHHTDTAPHYGEYAEYNGFMPWHSTNDADDVSVETSLCEDSDAEYAVYYEYTYTATVTVRETKAGEGYFLENESGGRGVRTINLTYTMIAKRSHECLYEESEPDEDGHTEEIHVGDELTPWQYAYTIRSSDTGTDTQGGAHNGHLVGDLAFSNQIRRGQAQLVKTYDEDLDPWTVIGGEKPQMPGSWWTLELVSEGPDHTGAAGSENHPYVMLQPIAKGEPGYSVWGNSYRVVEDTHGSAQHAGRVFTADGGSNHNESTANESNVLITGGATDLNGNKKGQLYIYDIPYGYYKMTEIRCVANEGYVLETYFFRVNDDEDTPSNEVNDEVIKNEIVIVKRDSETEKIVPMAGTAFRIKYLGYYHTNPVTGKTEFMTNEHSGTYIKNNKGVDADDVYDYMFVTDITGRIKIPYELEYGVWQLEEITAPPGYYIGDYSNGGSGQNSNQTGNQNGFNDTVAIFDEHGNKIDYTTSEDIIFNYYTFEVNDQTKSDPDGDGIYEMDIVIQEVNAFNNATKGKIEVKKVAEQLVGFTESSSDYGSLTAPVYEMKPLPGAVFEIVAAGDITKSDGHERPALYDALGNEIVPELIELTHRLWPDAHKLEYAKLDDGSEAYISTTRESENDGKPNPDSKSATNIISANIMTAVKGGVEYSLNFELQETNPLNGIISTSVYELVVGLEYAAGGWNYSYLDVTRTTTTDDYVNGISKSMPVVTNNGTDYKLSDLQVGTIKMPDGSSITINEKLDECLAQAPVDGTGPLTPIFAQVYRLYTPILEEVPAYAYLSESTALSLTIPDEYSSNPADPTVDNVSTYGGYCYTNGTDFIHAVQDPNTGEQSWMPSDTPDREMVQEYTNVPDSESLPGDGIWSVKEISITGDKGAFFTGDMYVFYLGSTEFWYVENGETGDMEWVEAENLAYAQSGDFRSSYNVPLPGDFELSTINFEFGYLAWSDSEATWAMLVRVNDTGELRWVRCTPERETFIVRTEYMSFDLNESNVSTGGFTMGWDGFILKNTADHDGEFSVASLTNPSGNQPVLKNGIGSEITTSEDGKTTFIKVAQPEQQAFWSLPDGTRVSMTYLGGYTKTILEVPNINYLPSITYHNSAVNYFNKITPEKNLQTTDMGGGNYIEAAYNQVNGNYTLTIISNAKTEAGSFKITYSTGQTGYSIVVNDPESGATRGQLNVTTIAKTLVYQSGHVIETIVSDSKGVAYSKELPLGTFYVREVDAGFGHTISSDSYEVSLDYAGQYVPLVWGSTSVSNAALDVNIDIAKGFQEAQGSDKYIYKAGAVFGVYNNDDIQADFSPSDSSANVSRSVARDSLMGLISIGDDGFATTTLKLPYGNDFYIHEVDTLDGYDISDVKYLFRVDEQTIADNLKLACEHDGITGEINQTDLFETTIVIDTLFQVPARFITINGVELSSDFAVAESIAGAAIVKNEVMADMTRLTIKATNAAPTVVQLENGAVLVLNVYSDGYTAEFTSPTETDCSMKIDKGNVSTTSIKEETFGNTVKYTYNPVIAYTGYTVDVKDIYREPTTVMTTKDGVRALVVFDAASGKRTMELTYPKSIPLPEIKSEQSWLTQRIDERKVIVDMESLLTSGMPAYEYKVITERVDGVVSAKHFAYVIDSKKTLTANDVIKMAGAVAEFNKKAGSITVDADQLQLLNDAIVQMMALEDKTTKQPCNLTFTTKDAKGNTLSVVVTAVLMGKDAVVTDSLPGMEVKNEQTFLSYGESIYFDLTPNSFAVSTSGKACEDNAGKNDDGITVTYAANNTATTLSYINETYAVTGQNATSSIRAAMNHNNTVANIYVAAGSIVSAYNGTLDVTATFVNGYPVSRGEVLTLVAADGVLYTVKLDRNGTFNLHEESLINGAIATEDKAPFATVNDVVTYKNLRLGKDTTVEFGETITYRRSSNSVSALSVKVNSKSDNHFTGNEENGSSSGRPDQIPNDIITVDFIKKDMNGRPLAGAVIAVYDMDGNEVWRGTTDEHGNARWDHATPGVFNYSEVVAPNGYELDNTAHPLTIYKDGAITGVLTIFNREKPDEPDEPTPPPVTPPDTPKPKPKEVTINKVDAATQEGIPGAKIEVLNYSKTEVIATGATDKNGHFTFDMPADGRFWFHETVAPNGYVLNEAWFEFSVKNGKVIGDNVIPNEREKKKEPIVIHKTDASTAAGVPGAGIQVLNADRTKLIAAGFSDANGNFTLECPEDGIFWFRETSAPSGYVLNESWFSFTVKDGKVSGDDTIPNERTKVIISKEDVTNAQGVPGATIEVIDTAGKIIASGQTDSSGYFGFYRPDSGIFYFHETVAPEGYILNEEFFSFTVNQDCTITGDNTITNVPSTIIVHKEETITRVPIEGATIEFYDESGLLLQVCMTDKDGNAYFAAPKIGTYIYKETLAPEGYILDEGTHTITIHGDGTITGERVFVNAPYIPRTGVADYTILFFVLTGAMAAGLVVMIIVTRKRKK